MEIPSDRRISDSDSLTSKESELQAQREFRTKVNAADRVGGIFICLMLLYFFPFGRDAALWRWSLIAMVAVCGSVFIWIWRWSHNRKLSSPDESLPDVIRNSLSHVETEIWLHRHAHWYRYIPIYLSIVVYYVYYFWSMAAESGTAIVQSVGDAVVIILIVGFAILMTAVVLRYFFSAGMKAALAKLETRRQELLSRLTNAGAETAREI